MLAHRNRNRLYFHFSLQEPLSINAFSAPQMELRQRGRFSREPIAQSFNRPVRFRSIQCDKEYLG